MLYIVVRIFKNIWFARFARKEGITDYKLREAVGQLETGQTFANLGGGVYKLRVARIGQGKSGGYRVILFFMNKRRAFYHYAYPKSTRGNISRRELSVFKKLAKWHFAMTDEQLADALKTGVFEEIQEEK